jgi:DNA polymerase
MDDRAPDERSVLAAQLAERIRWEVETGVDGYPPASVQDGGVSPVATTGAAAADLSALRERIGDCRRCELAAGRAELVFGEGAAAARLMFVGEGPGHEEDLSGRPFVGAAGQLLDRMIAAIGLAREQVYICNVVKCRPPNNRDPLPDEAATCGRFLREQIAIVAPEVIVALGRPAAQFLLQTDAPIGALRGRFHDLGGIALMPTYHPAYLLRNATAKRPVWEDLKQVIERLGLAGASPGRGGGR